jgi:hypothetical protein
MTGDQKKRIIEVLEQEYEGPGPEALAEALWDVMWELIQEMDLNGVFVKFEDGTTRSYGPAKDRNEAKAAAKFFGLGPDSVRKLSAMIGLRYKDEPPEGSRYCEDCKHPTLAHGTECLVAKCDCTRQYK